MRVFAASLIVVISEWLSNGGAHIPLLGTVRFIDQERNPQPFELRVFLKFLQYPGEFLLGGDDYWTPLRDVSLKIIRFPSYPDDVVEMREVLDLIANVFIQRPAISKNEDHIHQLLTGASLEQAVQAIRKPADSERFARTC